MLTKNKKKLIIVVLVSMIIVCAVVAVKWKGISGNKDHSETSQQEVSDNISGNVTVPEQKNPCFDNPKDFIKEEWRLAYYNKLVEIRNENLNLDESVRETEIVSNYSLYDLDKDNIPELILYRGLSHSVHRIEIYCYCDDEVIYIDDVALDYATLYYSADMDGLMLYFRRYDYADIYKLILENGEISSEHLASGKRNDPILYVDDIVPEAKLLSKYSISFDLPLVEYGIMTEKLICSVNRISDDEVEDSLLEALSNVGKVYAVSEYGRFESGYKSFGELCKPGGIHPKNQLVIDDYIFVDVNCDDRQELIVNLVYEHELYAIGYVVILSLQEDIVYAYCIEYDCDVTKNGMFLSSVGEAVQYSFYKDEFYAGYVADYSTYLQKLWDAGSCISEMLPDTDFAQDKLPKDILIKDICQGDIGNDGIKDVAVVFEYAGDATKDAWYPDEVNDRVLFVYREIRDEYYVVSYRNYNLIKGRTEGGVFGDPYNGIAIEDGMLKVSDYGGSSSRWGNEYYFGYHDDTFALCKYVEYSHSTHTANGVASVYDYAADGFYGEMEQYAISFADADFEPLLIYKGTFWKDTIRFRGAQGSYTTETSPKVYLPALVYGKYYYDYFGVSEDVAYIRDTSLNSSTSETFDKVMNRDYPNMKKVEMELEKEIFDNWKTLLSYEIPQYYYKNDNGEVLYFHSVTVEDGKLMHNICHSADGIIRVSDNSSDELLAMENQYYAEWDGNIYFRQYHADSFIEGALWADYDYASQPLLEKDFVCMDAQGNVTKVGKDYGYGAMYIVDAVGNDPRIYSTMLDEDGLYKIYSCDLAGKNSVCLHSSEIRIDFCGRYEDKIAFCEGHNKIGYVDLKNGDVSYFRDFREEEYLGINEKGVYYIGHQYSEDADFYICKGSYDGKTEILDQFRIVDLVPDDMLDECLDAEGNLLYFATSYETADVDIVEKKIYFLLQGYAGTGHFPQGGALFELNMATEICTKISKMPNVTKFRVVAQDANTWIYYPQEGYVDGEYEVWTENFPIDGNTEADAPDDVNARYDMGGVTQQYYSHGGYGVYATPDANGCSYEVLSEEEINSLGIGNPTMIGETNADVYWSIERAEYIGDKLFFSVVISDHDREQNVGWRDFYVRRVTYDYCKDLSSGEITLLQSY